MTQSSKKNRIIFIDLIRAFAVLQMVQGHTVDLLLANDYRNLESPFFAAWFFMRGMTAPIFLFTSGTVFTYLFRLHNEPFNSNPRVKKGFKRFLLLIGIGYLLRYPTATIFDFSQVSEKQWKIFFAVDVLQLIGFGILFVVLLAWLAEKIKMNDYYVFGFFGLIFFLLFPYFSSINWKEFLPVPIAGYFYRGTGSLFPLVPWAGYVIAGGILGSYLAKKPMIFKTARFSRNLAILGIVLMVLSYVLDLINTKVYGNAYRYDLSLNISLFRLGFVLILNALVSFISLKIETIPKFLILVGRNTLLIYVIHLMILYGSAWNPGLSQLFAKSFNVWKTLLTALAMLFTMTAMVLIINKLRIKNKQLVT
ncbi:MAG: heparan-alpha-glucosaminide N-acetyltransferase domain-containing protein [Ignavibacteriaceae bacterium]